MRLTVVTVQDLTPIQELERLRAEFLGAEELLGIVAGVSSSRSSFSSYLMASEIASSQRSPASTAAACEPMAGIASQHAPVAPAFAARAVRVRERQDRSFDYTTTRGG